jgi:hypothetical protein
MSLSESIQQLIETSPSARTDGGVCTSWILVTEWVDSDGSVWLEENRTADLPAWRRLGILNYISTEPEADEPYDE